MFQHRRLPRRIRRTQTQLKEALNPTDSRIPRAADPSPFLGHFRQSRSNMQHRLGPRVRVFVRVRKHQTLICNGMNPYARPWELPDQSAPALRTKSNDERLWSEYGYWRTTQHEKLSTPLMSPPATSLTKLRHPCKRLSHFPAHSAAQKHRELHRRRPQLNEERAKADQSNPHLKKACT